MAERLTVARPYAKAVFALASAGKQLPQWSAVLGTAAQVAGDPRVARLIGHPAVSDAERVELIAGVIGAGATPEVKNFLATLAGAKRLGFLPEIAAVYEQLRADAERTLEATVSSAVPLSAAQVAAFAAALRKRTGREVHLSTVIDPDLLGGAVLRADDLVIDGSLQGGLKQLAAQVTA